jgi:hypothetical protein
MDIKVSSDQISFICLAVAVLGVAALYFYSLAIQPKDLKISEISITPVGQYIRISGIVDSIDLGASFSKFTVCDALDSSACVSVRFSNDLLSSVYSINENDIITAKGIIQEYYNNKYLEVKSGEAITKAE